MSLVGSYLAFFSICLSLLCGRISIVLARGGVVDHSFFLLIIGLVANLVWVSSIAWFYLYSSLWIAVGAVIIGIFGLNLIVRHDSVWLFEMQNLIRVLTITLGIGIWLL